MAGCAPDDLPSTFELMNVLGSWPGRASSGKGDRFPTKAARESAARMIPLFAGRRVIVAGIRVAAAFGMRGVAVLEWRESLDATVLVMPHPSGVCRWWNEASNVETARVIIAAEVERVRCAA